MYILFRYSINSISLSISVAIELGVKEILTMSTNKEYQYDLIGVYHHFSSSKLEYAGVVRNFSAIVLVVLCQPMLQFVISDVKISVNCFERKQYNFYTEINLHYRNNS